MTVPIKVALVDDHTITREGIKRILNQDRAERFHVVGDFPDGQSFLDFLKEETCDVVLMDINMPGKSGDSTIEVIKQKYPKVSAVVLSMITNDYMIDRAISVGALGYLPKEADSGQIKKALISAHEKKIFFNSLVTAQKLNYFKEKKRMPSELSIQEKIIIDLIIRGFTNKEISSKLNIASGTVKKHRENILRKTNCKRSAHLLTYSLEMGIFNYQGLAKS